MTRFSGTPAFNLCALILNRPQFRLKNTLAPALRRGATPDDAHHTPTHRLASILGSNNPLERSHLHHQTHGLTIGLGNNGNGNGNGGSSPRSGAIPIGILTTTSPSGGLNRPGRSPAAMGVAFADPPVTHVVGSASNRPDDPSIDAREFSAAPLGKQTPSSQIRNVTNSGGTNGGAAIGVATISPLIHTKTINNNTAPNMSSPTSPPQHNLSLSAAAAGAAAAGACGGENLSMMDNNTNNNSMISNGGVMNYHFGGDGGANSKATLTSATSSAAAAFSAAPSSLRTPLELTRIHAGLVTPSPQIAVNIR
jgi:hypothetical protein